MGQLGWWVFIEGWGALFLGGVVEALIMPMCFCRVFV